MVMPAWGEGSLSALVDLVTHPGFVLSIVLALLYAAIFHVWQGRTASGLGWFILASLLGFALGTVAGNLLHFPTLGQVQILLGTVGSVLALFIVRMRKT